MASRPSPRQGLGRWGEDLAVARLQQAGYQIVERNFRCALGEIDVVAREGQTLVIVEVRTRRGTSHGSPEESVTSGKQARLRNLAEAYVQSLAAPPEAYRVDVVAVELTASGALRRVSLIKDALT